MKRTGKSQLIDDRRRALLRLEQRYNELQDAKRDLPVIPLDKPIRNGWERTFVLREDVKRSKDGPFFLSILAKLNNVDHCKRKDFKHKDYRTGKMKDIVQVIYDLDEKDYVKLSPQEQRHFFYTTKRIRRWHGYTEYRKVYVFDKSWMFVFKVRPSFLTHTKVTDGEIDSEIHKIAHILWDTKMALVYGLCDRGNWHYDDMYKVRDRIMENVLRKEMVNYYENGEF